MYSYGVQYLVMRWGNPRCRHGQRQKGGFSGAFWASQRGAVERVGWLVGGWLLGWAGLGWTRQAGVGLYVERRGSRREAGRTETPSKSTDSTVLKLVPSSKTNLFAEDTRTRTGSTVVRVLAGSQALVRALLAGRSCLILQVLLLPTPKACSSASQRAQLAF